MGASARLFFAASLLIFGGACKNESRQATVANLVQETCLRIVVGKNMFVGSVECMRLFPERKFSGTLLVGSETSVFWNRFIPASANFSKLEDEIWAELEPSGDESVREFGRASAGCHYITFSARMPPQRGVFGNNGIYSRGLLITHVDHAEKCTDRPPR